MSAINPINGPSAASAYQPAAATGAKAQDGGSGASFGQTLREAIGQIDGTQRSSDAAMQDVLTGAAQDLAPAVAAAAKADLSFKLLIGVRNKVIEAYKQTMNMPV